MVAEFSFAEAMLVVADNLLNLLSIFLFDLFSISMCFWSSACVGYRIWLEVGLPLEKKISNGICT